MHIVKKQTVTCISNDEVPDFEISENHPDAVPHALTEAVKAHPAERFIVVDVYYNDESAAPQSMSFNDVLERLERLEKENKALKKK